MPNIRVTGAEQLRDVGVKLRAAPPRLRSRLRRNIVSAASPITGEAKQAWQGGYGHLGAALAAATRTQVRTGGRFVGVAVRTDGSRMPEGQQTLVPLVEGLRGWRHPRFGDREHWYDQAPRPELGPAVKRHTPAVTAGVLHAVDETAQALARGSA